MPAFSTAVKKLPFFFGVSSFVLAGFLFGVSSARAQDDILVVVTPMKSERPIDSIPYSVVRVGGNSLNNKSVSSIDDILRDVANVDAAGGPRFTAEEPSIRGLSDRRIVIKVDGIRRNFRGQYGGRYFIDPWMIDGAEIVRGGNSSVDGSGAIAGVMQFFTPSARQELRGTGKDYGFTTRAGYQGVNRERAGLVQGYATQGALDGLVSISSRDSKAFKTGRGTSLVPGDANLGSYLAKVGYQFDTNHRMELRAADYNDRAQMPVSPFQPLSATNAATFRQSRVRDLSFHYRMAPKDNDLRKLFDVTAIAYRSAYDIDTRRYTDGRLDQTDFFTYGFDVYNTSRYDIWGAPNKTTFGVEYFRNEQRGKRNGGFRPLLGDGGDTNLGLYFQNQIDLTSALSVVPSLRYDIYELVPTNATLSSNNKKQLSPKIGVNWKLDDAWSVYGSVGKAFRTPTLTELYATGTLFPGNTLQSNPNLQPEIATNKEIGLRYRKPDLLAQGDLLKFSVTLFQNNIEDYIEQVIGATTTQFRNVSTARLNGFEVDARYTYRGYTAGLTAGQVRGKNQTTREPLSDVPPNRYVVTFEKDFLDDHALKLGARGTHYASQKLIPNGQPLIVPSKSSNTMDVYTVWQPSQAPLDGLEVRAGVDNIFDENYVRHLAFVPEAGRNFKLDVKWKF